jgi:3-phosphoshikimate 1-carboxyvinyltransferase
LAKVETEISITTPLESIDYVKMTLEVLEQFGIRVDVYDNFDRFVIPANQTYKSTDSIVPGDFSSAAFLLAAAAITTSTVKINDLNYESPQGDKAILGILSEMGVEGKVCDNSVEINGTGNSLEPLIHDAKNIPDLVPIVTALACFAKGTTQISGAQRLKLKESDRLTAIHAELKKMGAKITLKPDGLVIEGETPLRGTSINSHNDHRIAMACAVAALRAEHKTTILNAGSVRKSYPQFFNHLSSLGAEIVGGKFDR